MNFKTVLIRTDSSTLIGCGHVMRCLVLAKALRDNGANVLFVCRKLAGNISFLIKNSGFHHRFISCYDQKDSNNVGSLKAWEDKEIVYDAESTIQALRENVSLIIVDHYSIGYRWHSIVSPVARRIMVIDDLANRRFSCDYLLDQTLARTSKDYKGLVVNSQLMLGSRYALIREEFHYEREAVISKRLKMEKIRRILISLGGTDPNNITRKILAVFNTLNLPPDTIVDVILGATSTHLNDIKAYSHRLNYSVNVYSGVSNMGSFVFNSDLAIGGGGISVYERSLLLLPSILVVESHDQYRTAHHMKNRFACLVVNYDQNFQFSMEKEFLKIYTDKSLYDQIAINNQSVCDRKGVYRVLSRIC